MRVGGMGLNLLTRFVRLNKGNKGRLEVFTNDGHVIIDERQIGFVENTSSFRGTLVCITLRCDDSFFHFASEDTGFVGRR